LKKVLKQAGVVHDLKSTKTVVSLLCMPYQKGKDTTVLIDLLWLKVVYYLSLFFFDLATIVTLGKSSLVYLFGSFFWEQLFWLWLKYRVETQPYYYWWTYVYHIKTMTLCGPVISIIKRHFIAGYVQPIMLQKLFKRTSAIKVTSHYENYGWFPLQMEAIMCLPQNRHFLWWAKIMGHKGGLL